MPQGSNLGPLLFLVFINDICAGFKANALLYADDLKLYSRIGGIEDALILQNDISFLEDWCRENCLGLNTKKCRVVSYSRRRFVTEHGYTINGDALVRSDTDVDLGVTFDEKFTFSPHVSNVVCNIELIGPWVLFFATVQILSLLLLWSDCILR